MTISIITIVYNNRETIESCIKSVREQTYSNVEHIIIDGGSTDGTQNEIDAYKSGLGYYISEKDNGLYAALNKGIRKANGSIIGILHSDDMFYESITLEKVVEAFQRTNADLIYGKGIFVDKLNINKIRRVYSTKNFKRSSLQYGWIPLHTTIFVKSKVFEKYGFYKETFSIASDYEISLRWFTNNSIQKYFLDEWLVKMRLGGKSTTLKLQKAKSLEDLKIIKYYNLGGVFTLICKIGRKVPQYLFPSIQNKK
tara:strand:- start:29960 stop:30721 length:762 start_codon:yes stop_codon:yes gene_type:complete